MKKLSITLILHFLSVSMALAQANLSASEAEERCAQLVQKIETEQEFGLQDAAYQHSIDLFTLAKKEGSIYFQGKARQLQSNYYLNIGNHDTIEDLLSFSLKAADETHSKELKANALLSMGKLKLVQGLPSEALSYAESALTLYLKMTDLEGQSRAEYQIGQVLQHQGNWTDAIEHYNASLLSATRAENDFLQAMSLIAIGSMNELQNDLTTATSFYRKAEVRYKKSNNQNGLSAVNNRFGNIAMGREQYDTAAYYYQKSKKIAQFLGIKESVAGLLFNLSLVYQYTGKIDTAWLYVDSAFSIAQEINNSVLLVETNAEYGFLSLAKGDYKSAIHYGNKALKLAQKTEYNTWIMNSAELLVDAYKATHNFEKALEMQDLFSSTYQNILSEETQRNVIRQQFQFTYRNKAIQDSIVYAQREAMTKLEMEKTAANLAKQRIALLGSGVAIALLVLLVSAIRKGKRKSDELLLNILPEEIAAELKANGKADARDFDMVSILFTDFKGFTEHSAKLSAADLVSEINTCFEAFDGIMEKYGIEKIKTIGDAYMAAGGLPVPTDDSIKNTVLAALEMQDFIGKRKAEMDEAEKPAFEMRVGIHTGPVVAGIVGVKKFQYDIWGDTVNTASRMESSGEVRKVNISQATYELLKNNQEFAFESRGKIEAKGKGEIEMYFVSKA